MRNPYFLRIQDNKNFNVIENCLGESAGGGGCGGINGDGQRLKL